MASSENYKRGQQIISPDLAAERAKRLLPLDDFGLTWGGLVLPSTEAVTHFCVVGATGSGKTTLLRLLMQSCLPRIGAEYKEKSYEITRSELKHPTVQEQESYAKALAAHQVLNAPYEAALRKNNEEIAIVREENRAIRERNRAIRRANQDTSKRIAHIDQELAKLQFVEESTTGIKIAMAAIPVLAYLSPELFYFTPWLPWFARITFQILLGLAFVALFFVLISKSTRRNNHNEQTRTRRESLQRERTTLVLLSEENEKVEPKPLVQPALPPLMISRPYSKTVVVNEDKKPAQYSGPGHRALIYDAKNDIVSLLHGMQLGCAVEILNPFDSRATAWNIARDFTTPASARQFATILVPEDKNASQPFFANSARDVIGQVILSLIHLKPGKWTLRDLVLATQSRPELVAILNQTAQGKAKAKTYFGDSQTGNSILSEIATRMAPFESVAQAWSHANRRVSLTEWIEKEFILVIGSNEEHRAALDPINRVLFQRATELVLSQSESDSRRTWFFLDEVRDLGNLDSLGRLMTKGRSKGVSVVLGFQDIEGMHDAFGKERANEFIGQCANKAVLRLNSPETAKWASELFGKYEFIEEETGENKGGSKTTGNTETTGQTTGKTETTGTSQGTSIGTSKSVSYSEGSSTGSSETYGDNFSSSRQRGQQDGKQTSEQESQQKSDQTSESLATQTSDQTSKATNASDTESWTTTINKKRMEKDALLPSQFMTLPVTNPRNGLHGYYAIPSIGAFYAVLDSANVKNSLMPPNKNYLNYEPRHPSQQILKEWSTHEKEQLGLIEKEKAATKSAAAAPPASAPTNVIQSPGDTPPASDQTSPVRQADASKVALLQGILNRKIR